MAAEIPDDLPLVFGFAPDFHAGVGEVLDVNRALLGFASAIATQINRVRAAERVLRNQGYIYNFYREKMRYIGELLIMRDGDDGIVNMIGKVVALGGVPVLPPTVVQDAMTQILTAAFPDVAVPVFPAGVPAVILPE